MRLYAPLLLTLLAVSARAASIPDKLQPELEKKLVSEDIPPAENVSQETVVLELVDPANTVIDVENNLRKNAKPEDIPVKVIIEDALPTVATMEVETVNEVIEDDGIKRPMADLRNPGPPQHQEHETQNPEHYEDIERTVSTVKDELHGAQVILRQGFQGVTNDIQNWYANNEQINNLQSSINNLQQSFAAQVQKLNDTLHNFLNNKPLNTEQEQETRKNFENIESGLKNLESNFKTGVQSLSEGVQVVATLREEGGSEPASTSSTSTTAAPAGFPNPFNYLVQLVSNLQTSMTAGFSDVSNAVNNFVTQNQPNIGLPSLPNLFPIQSSTAAPLADEAASGSTTTTTHRPSPWQNIQTSFNNLFNPNQTPQGAQNDAPTPTPTGPFGIPPFPIITSLVNLIQRPGAQTTEKPTEKPTAAPQASAVPAASDAVPPVKADEIITDVQKKPEPEVKDPIQKILENNPVVKGINVAVQRIQAISNPVKPRDEAEKTTAVQADAIEGEKTEEVNAEAQKEDEAKPEIVKKEEIKDESGKIEDTKEEAEQAPVAQVKGGHRPGSAGDNNDSGERVTPQEEQKAPITEDKKEEVKETEVSDKTE